MAEETAVLLNIGEMIDLAIGTPENGVVDFGMLQTVLHCLAQQLRVLGKNVELHGEFFTNLPVSRENQQTIAVSEYIVNTAEETVQAKPDLSTQLTQPLPPPKAAQETMLVVERRKRSSDLTAIRSPTRPRSPPTAAKMPLSEKLTPSTEKLSLVTISKFNILENTVQDLKSRVYGSMPKNEEILQEVRSQTNLKAITDMWTSLNVSSRLEATETGLTKLSSLVQDVISDTATLQNALKNMATAPALAEPPQAPAVSASSTAPPAQPPPSTAPDASVLREIATINSTLATLRGDLNNLTNSFYTALAEFQESPREPAQQPPPPPPSAPSSAEPDVAPPEPPALPAQAAPSVTRRRKSEFPLQEVMERIVALEKRLKECCDSIGKADGGVQDQINSFQDQLEFLMKQVNDLTAELSLGKLSPDLIKDLQGLMKLFETVQEMQEQLKQVHDTALQLADEKEERQYHMNALLEQIELLKTIKLDREDMVEAMAEKADLRMLARKVSHDQFELACDDLSRGLEQAIGKLNVQEALWQQALDDIQREIELKLDKMELSPIKEFFNNKLKQLQQNLKQMAAMRQEVEAAGTKRRLLRDVNCISCDAKAVMPMDAQASLPMARPLPANLSMKPYLSYELDTIRKAQAANVTQRNMHDWENIDKQMAQQKPPQRVRSDTGKHICNRYCGGSHTVTTPAQRVARLGHFIKQWGPDVVPLSSGLAAGDDGRMYKVSTVEGANVGPGGAVETCTPKKPTKSTPVRQSPILMEAECRCLERTQQ